MSFSAILFVAFFIATIIHAEPSATWLFPNQNNTIVNVVDSIALEWTPNIKDPFFEMWCGNGTYVTDSDPLGAWLLTGWPVFSTGRYNFNFTVEYGETISEYFPVTCYMDLEDTIDKSPIPNQRIRIRNPNEIVFTMLEGAIPKNLSLSPIQLTAALAAANDGTNVKCPGALVIQTAFLLGIAWNFLGYF